MPRLDPFVERMALIPGPDGAMLEGLWYGGGPEAAPVILSAPHPGLGGSMDSPVLTEIALALGLGGSPTLRYNYRSVGGASPQPNASDRLGQEAQADLACAIDYMLEPGSATPGRAVLVGYSFGAWVSFRLARKEGARRIGKLILVAPPTSMMDFSGLDTLDIPTLVIVGEEDGIADPDRIRALTRNAPPTLQLELLPEADHFFFSKLVPMARLAAAFL